MSDGSNHARRRGRRPSSSRNLTFAANLKRLRLRDGLTQEQLNDALDLAVGTVARWEQRTHEPTLDQLVQLAAHFSVLPGQLLDPTPIFSPGSGVPPEPDWQRFVLELLGHYPSNRIEINFWADHQTAHIYPTAPSVSRSAEPPEG